MIKTGTNYSSSMSESKFNASTPVKDLSKHLNSLVSKAKKSGDASDAWKVVDFLYDFPNVIMNESSAAGLNENKGKDLVYATSKGAEIILQTTNVGSSAYFYNSRGDADRYTADKVYKDLYPQKRLDYVDTRGGFIEFKMDLEELQDYIKANLSQYKLTNKHY